MQNRAKNQVVLAYMMSVCIGVFVFAFALHSPVDAAQKKISIENNALKTSDRDVSLAFFPDNETEVWMMQVSNDIAFTDAPWKPYVKTKKWTIGYGSGVKSVYVRFKNVDEQVSNIFHDTIELDVPKEMNISVQINKNAKETKNRNTTLTITYSKGVEEMFISNTEDFSVFDGQSVHTSVPWVLTEGSGEKTVYVQFRDANNNTKTVSDTITYKEPPGTIAGGTLIQAAGSSIYYLGFDGQIHPFLNSAVFHSWYDDMSTVKIKKISKVALKKYSVGKAMCVRGGTWIVKFQNFPQLYAVETGCQLFPIRSEVEAYILYGPDWNKRVVVLDDIDSGMYKTYYRGVQDIENEILDKDADGVDKETEEFYGTSDSLPDTDGDGLSDIEEILVWFTEPTIGDTDENGLSDAQDVISTYLAQGGKIDVPEVYMYPSGHVFEDRDSHWYYMSYADHLIYFLSKKISDHVYTSNKIIDRFVPLSSPYISYTPRKGWHVEATSFDFLFPTLITDKHLLYVL